MNKRLSSITIFEELNDDDALDVNGGAVAPGNDVPWWCRWLMKF